jgi:hypothetical protein
MAGDRGALDMDIVTQDPRVFQSEPAIELVYQSSVCAICDQTDINVTPYFVADAGMLALCQRCADLFGFSLGATNDK